jgi:integrase
MLPLRSHLTLKRGIFYYRRKLPLPHIGEVAVSLRTSHYREAQHLARVADLAFRSFFRSVLSMADVQAILRQHLVDALEEDRARHLSTPHGRPVYVQGGQLDDHDCPVDADLELIGALLSDAREALATRNVKRVAHLVQTYMALHDLGESQRHALAMGLLKADVQALETSERRLVDGVVDEIQLFPASSSSGERGTVAPASGPLLSEVLPRFMGLMSTEGGWRAQTLMQNKKTYQIFLEVCGDLPVGAYKRPELAKTLDLLRALPDDYGKAKRWRGLALREIAEISKGSESRLAVKTLKRHFAALGSLFKHLIERGEYEGANPAHGFSFPEKMRPKMKRQQWDGDRLTKLFNSPVWTGCKSKSSRSKAGSLVVKDDKYWLPLLGLYHGNRLEEFAQLIRSDLRREDSIWYFDINDDGDKQVKNEQSKRRVPVHPQLLALGLIEYIEDIAPSSSDPLFPQLKPGGADGKRGHAFTKWWTRYRKEVGLYEPGLDYHSFRHGVTTKLFASGVSEVFVDELTGHEGKGTSRAVYTKEMPLRKLYEAICQVEWPEVSITP